MIQSPTRVGYPSKCGSLCSRQHSAGALDMHTGVQAVWQRFVRLNSLKGNAANVPCADMLFCHEVLFGEEEEAEEAEDRRTIRSMTVTITTANISRRSNSWSTTASMTATAAAAAMATTAAPSVAGSPRAGRGVQGRGGQCSWALTFSVY